MGYPDMGYVVPRDTRKYGGLVRRTLWRARRYVERKMAWSQTDVYTYEYRLERHINDKLRDRYIQQLSREQFWLNVIWQPLASLLRVITPEKLKYFDFFDVDPGNRSIANWLNQNPHLSHSQAGSNEHGVYVEWYSLDPAPWSGQREDWLLWLLDNGGVLVDGPLNVLHAQSVFMNFDAEVQKLYRMYMEDAYPYGQEGYEAGFGYDPGYPGYVEEYDPRPPQPAYIPFGIAAAAGLTAREIDDYLIFDEDFDDDEYGRIDLD